MKILWYRRRRWNVKERRPDDPLLGHIPGPVYEICPYSNTGLYRLLISIASGR